MSEEFFNAEIAEDARGRRGDDRRRVIGSSIDGDATPEEPALQAREPAFPGRECLNRRHYLQLNQELNADDADKADLKIIFHRSIRQIRPIRSISMIRVQKCRQPLSHLCDAAVSLQSMIQFISRLIFEN